MLSTLAALLALPLAAQPVAVSSAAPSASLSTSAPHASLRLLSESEYPDFHETFQSKASLAKAAKNALAHLKYGYAGPKYITMGDRQYAVGSLIDSLEELLSIIKEAKTPDEFAQMVRERFDVFQSVGSDGNGKVVFSSYYQPVLEASKQKSPKYPYAIYRYPPDMVEVDLGAFDRKRFGDFVGVFHKINEDSDVLIGRVDKNKKVVPYFSRGQIDFGKALAGKGLELAWLKDRFDVLDLHIQGSGILKFPSGKQMLAGYAATNALPFNAIGLSLVKAGIFTKENISHEKLREYLHEHPEAADWVFEQDPRYTFFELKPVAGSGEPVGYIGYPLVAARSLAVDPSAFPIGALAYLTTTSPQADEKGNLLGLFPNSRFAVAMDKGGAILGPGHIDIYAGHGPQAQTTARNQWADGKLYFLVKKIPPRER